MKRKVVLVLLCLVSIGHLFAYSNGQRIISVDGPEYKAMETLYILAGRSLPSSSGPWSEREMTLMLDHIDRSSLSDSAREYYDYVWSLIVSDPLLEYNGLALDFSAIASLEGYLHTDTKNFVDESDWFHGFTSRRPFAELVFESWPSDSIYGYFEITFGHSYGLNVKNDSKDNLLYKNLFNINIPYVNAYLFSNDGTLESDCDWTYPYKALGSVGGESWNLIIGRDKLSWGNGETGNLMLSSSFPKETLIRFNTFHDIFKYSLLYAFYPGVGYEKVDDKYGLPDYKCLITHRLEFSLFDDKVGFTLNEACMYWSTRDYPFSLMHINPFGFLHNEFVARNGNSLMVFEADYTPFSGLNIYGQLAIDEMPAVGEGRENPSALGYLAGVKGALAAGKGVLYGSFEFAYTDPFLYIRGLYEDGDNRSGYGYDAILRIVSGAAITTQRKFITYTYGNDAIVFDSKLNYSLPGKFRVGFETMFMLHGSMNAESNWGNYTGEYVNAPDIKTPTTFNPFNGDDYDSTTDTIKMTHPVEKSLILSITGEYNIFESLSVYGIADCLLVNNINNSNVDSADFQFTFGLSYAL